MKKWIAISVSVMLAIIISAINLFFYLSQANELEGISKQVALLQQENQNIREQLDEGGTRADGFHNRLDSIEVSLEEIDSCLEELRLSFGDISSLGEGLGELDRSITEIKQQLSSLEIVDASQIMDNFEPFVVYIEGTYFGYQVSGSGVLVSAKGHVVTNYHVVEGLKTIDVVISTGETFTAEMLDYDIGRDFAIIKLVTERNDFPFAPLGDSDNLLVGSGVLAVGYPSPLGDIVPGRASVTRGIVSAIRKIDGFTYVQTDTAINPGNSGGALVNFSGELIGINVAKYVDVDIEGIDLAIPVSEVKSKISEYAG